MDTLRELYKVGNGPSSSHTMGPKKAALIFKNKNLDADRFEVELYGSLAATGKGHLTDYIVRNTLGSEKTNVKFLEEVNYDYHPNGVKFIAYKNNKVVDEWLVFSVGGGELRELNELRADALNDVYPLKYMEDILNYCEMNKMSFYDYVIKYEGKEILEYASMILDVMIDSIERGFKTEGHMPGPLKVERKAKNLYDQYLASPHSTTLQFASSLAVSEENACGGEIVTAPTCGSSGVVPGALYTELVHYKKERKLVIEGLLVGGLIGNIIKHTGSISGAEVGCQGEIGVACSMAAAAITYIQGGTNKQIEYASEIALEHHLGLTCDPVMGYVQIPCIERNAMSCKRAFDSSKFALLTNGEHYIKLDDAVKTMVETGKDLDMEYRETSLGGLAKHKIIN
jgi:L-serine dehydratase